MKGLFLSLITVTITLSNINFANASLLPQQIPVNTVSTNNIFTITQNSIIDNVLFEEMSYSSETGNWFTSSIWWQGKGQIILDLGNSFVIQDMLIQVDYNDNYYFDYSIDNLNWSPLFTITPEDGEIASGMDTMSSDELHNEYVANMDFSASEARYLRVSASSQGGNGIYVISELQVFGNPPLTSSYTGAQTVSPVPEPSSLMLFSAGLMVLAGLQYRRKKQMCG
ncbi:MAG: PEP-CTERM sorting domain-containing protein [Thiomicrorhabdus sp.]|nr:PEP-CTERM sorting domain-containing protein [Thiomicrorhabdus sp.]